MYLQRLSRYLQKSNFHYFSSFSRISCQNIPTIILILENLRYYCPSICLDDSSLICFPALGEIFIPSYRHSSINQVCILILRMLRIICSIRSFVLYTIPLVFLYPQHLRYDVMFLMSLIHPSMILPKSYARYVRITTTLASSMFLISIYLILSSNQLLLLDP